MFLKCGCVEAGVVLSSTDSVYGGSMANRRSICMICILFAAWSAKGYSLTGPINPHVTETNDEDCDDASVRFPHLDDMPSDEDAADPQVLLELLQKSKSFLSNLREQAESFLRKGLHGPVHIQSADGVFELHEGPASSKAHPQLILSLKGANGNKFSNALGLSQNSNTCYVVHGEVTDTPCSDWTRRRANKDQPQPIDAPAKPKELAIRLAPGADEVHFAAGTGDSGLKIKSNDEKKSISIQDEKSGDELFHIDQGDGSAPVVSTSPDGKTIVVQSYDADGNPRVQLFDKETKKLTDVPLGNSKDVKLDTNPNAPIKQQFFFSPDGKKIVLTDENGQSKIIDLNTNPTTTQPATSATAKSTSETPNSTAAVTLDSIFAALNRQFQKAITPPTNLIPSPFKTTSPSIPPMSPLAHAAPYVPGNSASSASSNSSNSTFIPTAHLVDDSYGSLLTPNSASTSSESSKATAESEDSEKGQTVESRSTEHLNFGDENLAGATGSDNSSSAMLNQLLSATKATAASQNEIDALKESVAEEADRLSQMLLSAREKAGDLAKTNPELTDEELVSRVLADAFRAERFPDLPQNPARNKSSAAVAVNFDNLNAPAASEELASNSSTPLITPTEKPKSPSKRRSNDDEEVSTFTLSTPPDRRIRLQKWPKSQGKA